MIERIYMGIGDRLPVYSETLEDANGPIDLTTATVTFSFGRRGQTASLGGACTVTNAVGGVVSYAWNATDTVTKGVYVGRFVIIYPGSKAMSVPNSPDYITIVVS